MKGNRSVILSIVVLILILATGYATQIYLDKTTAIILKELDIVEKSINIENWDDASKRINNLTKNWDKTAQRWSALTNHDEIDNITISFKTTSEFIKNKEKTDSLAALASLKHFIYHIPLMEKVSLENIF